MDLICAVYLSLSLSLSLTLSHSHSHSLYHIFIGSILYLYHIYRFPLEHIDDCEGSKHFLEMNFYKHVLSKYYKMTVSYMAIASFHPSTGDNYFMAEAPSWNEEISTILRNVPDDDKDKES